MNTHMILKSVISDLLLHARRNGIESSLYSFDDTDALIREIAGSQLIGWQYLCRLGQYQFTLRPSGAIRQYAIHDFIMTERGSSGRDISLMIEMDLWNGESKVNITLTLPFERHPPFAAELLNDGGMLRVSDSINSDGYIPVPDDMIIKCDEWKILVSSFTGQGKYTFVEVD